MGYILFFELSVKNISGDASPFEQTFLRKKTTPFHEFSGMAILVTTLKIDVRQIEIHTADPLVPEPRPSEDETAIEKLKRYKSPGSDQISAELIQAGGEILRSKIHELIHFI
jgi:hypothetical protein